MGHLKIGTFFWDIFTGHFFGTHLFWDKKMGHHRKLFFKGTFLRDIFTGHFYGTFLRDIFMGHFFGTFFGTFLCRLSYIAKTGFMRPEISNKMIKICALESMISKIFLKI